MQRLKIKETEKEKLRKQIDDLILEEMMVCYRENTSTSRLTSLIMKINNLFNS